MVVNCSWCLTVFKLYVYWLDNVFLLWSTALLSIHISALSLVAFDAACINLWCYLIEHCTRRHVDVARYSKCSVVQAWHYVISVVVVRRVRDEHCVSHLAREDDIAQVIQDMVRLRIRKIDIVRCSDWICLDNCSLYRAIFKEAYLAFADVYSMYLSIRNLVCVVNNVVMDFAILFIFVNRTNLCILLYAFWTTIACCKVHWQVLVTILEEAPYHCIDTWICEYAWAIRAATKQWSSLLSIWKSVRLCHILFIIDTWNPDLAFSSCAMLQDLASIEAI